MVLGSARARGEVGRRRVLLPKAAWRAPREWGVLGVFQRGPRHQDHVGPDEAASASRRHSASPASRWRRVCSCRSRGAACGTAGSSAVLWAGRHGRRAGARGERAQRRVRWTWARRTLGGLRGAPRAPGSSSSGGAGGGRGRAGRRRNRIGEAPDENMCSYGARAPRMESSPNGRPRRTRNGSIGRRFSRPEKLQRDLQNVCSSRPPWTPVRRPGQVLLGCLVHRHGQLRDRGARRSPAPSSRRATRTGRSH